ncbi:prolyl 4-hydroxylase subunit alpha-2-like [Drosophila tropicalis]|uniref:prolyl 4-hydroxylase subunit alpha-2-like n=1 Tax=Drosophila tropicalis TaxID=46794 RepID=UPI0035ABDE18
MISYLILLGCVPLFAEMHNFASFNRNLLDILYMENSLLSHLNQYAMGLQRKVDMLHLVLAEAEQREKQANGDPEKFIANPVTSLSLFRRMYEDVPKLIDFLKTEMETDSLKAILNYNSSVVDAEEFREAAAEILPWSNANDHKQYGANLNFLDCLALGNYLWQDLDQGHLAIKWLKLALERYDENLKPLDGLLNSGRIHILQNLIKVQLAIRQIE